MLGQQQGGAMATLLQAAEQTVREDWEQSGRNYYFDQYVFDQCWSKIWMWLKIQPVKDILMKYHLIEDQSDVHVLTNPFLDPKQQADNLLFRIVPKAGIYGHYLLYIAIRDSIPSNPLGHSQAIDELKQYAEGRNPPWEQPAPYPIQASDDGVPQRPFHTDGRTWRSHGQELVAGSIPHYYGGGIVETDSARVHPTSHPQYQPQINSDGLAPENIHRYPYHNRR